MIFSVFFLRELTKGMVLANVFKTLNKSIPFFIKLSADVLHKTIT